MARFVPPISQCSIILTKLVKSRGALDPRAVWEELSFTSIQSLGNYLQQANNYPVALSLEYNVRMPANMGNSDADWMVGRLTLSFRDSFATWRLEFDSALDLVQFLKAHPDIAKCMNYSPTGDR
jgi:hypothetical protein